MKEPKLFFYDIERFPNEGYTWGKWEQNVIQFTKEGMTCSIAWQWADQKKVHCISLPDYYGYLPDYKENKKMMRAFYKEYVKADVVIAHNAKGFDEKHLNTDFLLAGLKPPQDHMVIDTLRIARSRFAFNSNKLDDLCMRLGLVRKVKHPGFQMWIDCMRGDKKAWAKMVKYNIGDIPTLRGLYMKIRAWDKQHPNLSNFRRDWNCSVCGSSDRKSKGYRYNKSSISERWVCKKCGKNDYGPCERRQKMF